MGAGGTIDVSEGGTESGSDHKREVEELPLTGCAKL